MAIHRLAPLIFVTALLVRPAAAQDAVPQSPPRAASARAAPVPVKVTIPDPEKLKRTTEHLAKMRGWVDQVAGGAEQARRERDVLKLNCVNEALTQMKALLRVAESADLAMREAVSRKDPSADAEYARVAIAKVKVEKLRREGTCIGQLAYLADERTTVEVTGPELPDPGVSRPPSPSAATPPVVRPRPASEYY